MNTHVVFSVNVWGDDDKEPRFRFPFTDVEAASAFAADIREDEGLAGITKVAVGLVRSDEPEYFYSVLAGDA